MSDDLVIMPKEDWAAALDALRQKIGTQESIKSGELAALIESISNSQLTRLVTRRISEVSLSDLSGAEDIGSYAFYGCTDLVSITLPSSVTGIGQYAFSECRALTEFVIPEAVTSIGMYAFHGCAAITDIVIPDNITTLMQSLFSWCEGLSSVTIGAGVKWIEGQVFYYCTHLKNVIVKAETPPSVQTNTFMNVPSNCAFWVPAVAVDVYKAATNWAERADHIYALEDKT